MFLRLYTSATSWWDGLKARAAEEGGATAVEYALMVALIAVVIIAAVAFIGTSSSEQFQLGRRLRRRPSRLQLRPQRYSTSGCTPAAHSPGSMPRE